MLGKINSGKHQWINQPETSGTSRLILPNQIKSITCKQSYSTQKAKWDVLFMNLLLHSEGCETIYHSQRIPINMLSCRLSIQQQDNIFLIFATTGLKCQTKPYSIYQLNYFPSYQPVMTILFWHTLKDNLP